MTQTLPRLGAAALAAGAALCVTAAMAQPYGYDEETTVPGITVYAPRTIGRSSIGAPIRIVRESRIVYAGDLNLDSYRGNRILRHRVERAAREACDDLDARYPVSADGGQDCYGDAVRHTWYRIGYEP